VFDVVVIGAATVGENVADHPGNGWTSTTYSPSSTATASRSNQAGSTPQAM
jgi:hypothetical protein